MSLFVGMGIYAGGFERAAAKGRKKRAGGTFFSPWNRNSCREAICDPDEQEGGTLGPLPPKEVLEHEKYLDENLNIY